VIQIDNTPFDVASEHFSFPLFHVIADMDELAKLRSFPRLTSASFAGTNVDDRGLGHLAGVETLANLNLQDTKISNDGLAHLARLPRLTHLRLKDNRQLTNACIAHVLQLTHLTEIQIHETSIDQRGLDQLVALPSLTDICLDIRNDNYTVDALLALSARMPRCTILAKGRGEFRDGRFDGT
jgi:hypothetical protein